MVLLSPLMHLIYQITWDAIAEERLENEDKFSVLSLKYLFVV